MLAVTLYIGELFRFAMHFPVNNLRRYRKSASCTVSRPVMRGIVRSFGRIAGDAGAAALKTFGVSQAMRRATVPRKSMLRFEHFGVACCRPCTRHCVGILRALLVFGLAKRRPAWRRSCVGREERQ